MTRMLLDDICPILETSINALERPSYMLQCVFTLIKPIGINYVEVRRCEHQHLSCLYFLITKACHWLFANNPPKKKHTHHTHREKKAFVSSSCFCSIHLLKIEKSITEF